jgi:glycosyltransferase involved in cell wall biosynthesis
MRLLIVTQAVDSSDPILGFFHRWIEEFATQGNSVTVIGQRVGEYSLPESVKVYSLGKEQKRGKIMQIMRFRWLIWTLRSEYDVILVHMTPIWAVFAWRARVFLGKQIYLWYEARGGGWALRVALWIVKKAFSASKHGMPVKTSKSVIVGHGIDTDAFKPTGEQRDPSLLITVGRITASKRIPILLDALKQLPPPTRLLLAGEPRTSDDRVLQNELQKKMEADDLTWRVETHAVAPSAVAATLSKASLFLHASETSLDKALLEAMACECLVLSCADAAVEVLPAQCLCSPTEMALQAKHLLSLPASEQAALRQQLRGIVTEKHSLGRLVRRLTEEMRA